MSPALTLPAWLEAAIQALQGGNVSGWMNIYAADAVHEFPFAPNGWMTRLEGREAIATYMDQLPGLIHFGSLSNVRARDLGSECIVEATGHHRRVSDNAPITIDYVWFVTLRDGQVTHFRDYMNPLQLSLG
ncbi:nuclear transport factor 2 family protein [Burkholderia sp. A1]|uniref:nuclear transport factor 2 family protein n=1 Tax=Burkholderia sp. A1 TaxID=148446 RepID=UPI000469C7D9|nr:nuclear transport factor 2 family protein [Burkholderia sp. A1]